MIIYLFNNLLGDAFHMKKKLNNLIINLFVTLFVVTPMVAVAASTPETDKLVSDTQEHQTIDGFRSAKFGMKEADVKAMIEKDFGIKESDIQTGTNPSELTKFLLIKTDQLIKDKGEATIAYIFGYESKALMQVNIVWGNTEKIEDTNPQDLVDIANLLRNHFVKKSYESTSVVVNQPISDETILVYKASDTQNRTITLALTIIKPKDEKNQKEEAKSTPPVAGQSATHSLKLSYILDTKNPDIFKLEENKF